MKKIFFNKNDYIYIAGFNHFVTFTTILICIIFNKKYLVNDDVIKFKNNSAFKNILKCLIYRKSKYVLLCNILSSDQDYIDNNNNILYWPYVVDKNRLLKDIPDSKPKFLVEIFSNKSNTIIFSSARLIERKGCEILLKSFKNLKFKKNIFCLLKVQEINLIN